MKVAVIQLNASDCKEENLSKACRLIDRAAAELPFLIALPEYFNYMGPDKEKYAQAEPIPGPTSARLAEKAREHGTYILAGSILEKSPQANRCYNTSFLLDPAGEIAAVYRKINLFDVSLPNGVLIQESRLILPGAEKVVADTPEGKWGLTVCFDLRFPRLYRDLALAGAWVIFVPAAFSLYTGKDHWEVLLRARAIENQVYIVAPAQIGFHPPNYRTFGSSMIVGPWGTVVARAPEEEGYICAVLSRERLRDVRAAIPGPGQERDYR